MKKILIIILPFLLWGCQKKFNDVVNADYSNEVEVKSVKIADSFTYSISDSLMPVSITLTSSADVNGVFCNLYDPDNNQLNSSPVQLFDNGNIAQNSDSLKGDNEYSNKIPMSSSYVTGSYKIQFYVNDNAGNMNFLAVHFFNYTPGQPNVAPVISDLVAPDTATIGTSDVYIVITLKVQDGNGLKDIQSVYFNSYIPPDGNPSSSNPVPLYDNGTNGDKTAGDGIYTATVTLPPTGVPLGTFRWEFFAKDRSGALSNKITHYIVVK